MFHQLNRKVVSLVLTVMMLLSFGTNAAYAQKSGPDYSDPAVIRALIAELQSAGDKASARFQTLPPEAKGAVQKALTVARVKTQNVVVDDNPPHGVRAVTGGDCSAVTTSYDSYGPGPANLLLWKYIQQTEWCWDGEEVTSASRLNRYAEVYAPLWQFIGHTGERTSGGAGQTFFTAWTQGAFRMCAAGDIGCVRDIYPWVQQTVYGTGSYQETKGG